MWIRGGGKTLIHKMWIKKTFFFTPPLNRTLNQPCEHNFCVQKRGYTFTFVIS